KPAQLLRPLLTPRLRLSASPFQACGEVSSGKNTSLHRATAESTSPTLGHQSFAVCGPLALVDFASHPVSVRRPAASLHASSRRSSRFTPLRFASVAMACFRKDLHLQVDVHAERTTTRGRPNGAGRPLRLFGRFQRN